MKLLNKYKLFVVFIAAFCTYNAIAQDEKPTLLVDVTYHLQDNKLPFVTVFTKYKEERKFIAVPNISVGVYLGEEADSNLLGKVKTNIEGKGIVPFPVSIKSKWDLMDEFTLIASTETDKQFESATGEAAITKAKISIDTVYEDGERSIVVTVKAKNGDDWIPVADVETKVIIKRALGNLSIGDDATYTTDETGSATAEFMKTNIPGDLDGNIIIVAKTEDNDSYGNISIEQNVKWGVPFKPENTFNSRSLFATRDKAPLWLIFLAGSIIIAVWSVIIYLVFQIRKIRKIGIAKILVKA